MDALLVSIPDAAKALGLGRSKVYELMNAGKLETVTIGKRRLVRVESVRALALGDAHAARFEQSLQSPRGIVRRVID